MSQPPSVQPPRTCTWIVELFTANKPDEAMVGDVLEEFSSVVSRVGITSARCWYWHQSVSTIAQLVARQFRIARWSIAGTALGGSLLLWGAREASAMAAGAILTRYQVYEYVVSVVVFWRILSLIQIMIAPMLVGWIVAMAGRGREVVVAGTLSLLYNALNSGLFVFSLRFWQHRSWGSVLQNLFGQPQFLAWAVATTIALLIGATIRRKGGSLGVRSSAA